MKKLLTTGALLLMGAGSAAAQSEALHCTYSRRSVCTTEGCQPTSTEHGYLRVPPIASLQRAIVDSTRIRVDRCDDRDCIPLDIEQATSEGFITLSARGGAFLLKIFAQPDTRELGLRTGDFTEVVTSMMATWVGYGRCVRPASMPIPEAGQAGRTLMQPDEHRDPGTPLDRRRA